MKVGTRHETAGILFFFLLACAAFALWASDAGAESNFYVDRGCSGCHGTTPTTCNGCHHHGPSGLRATANKATYAPGENVIVTLTGGRSSGATNGVGGWIRAILYRTDASGTTSVVATSTGTGSPPRGGSGFPITFTTPAPTAPGSYTYAAAWFGNSNDSGSTHGEQRATSIAVTVAAASVAGPLTVTPAGGLTSSWTVGSTYTPVSQAYVLTNTGTASMAWTASKVASWVTLSSTGGTLAAGGTVTVTASTNSGVTGLTAGSYTDTVTFTNGTNGTGNTTRGVSLTVTAASVAGPLTVTPAGGLTSSWTIGSTYTPVSQAYVLTNTGTASMAWTASKVASWVTLSSTGGTLAAGGTVTVTASTNSGVTGLTAGSYSDTVTFTNGTNGTGNTTRGVSLTVTAASVAGPLTVTPAGGLTSSWTIGSTYTPVSQAYVLTNTGTASMAWTASKVASWVTLSSTGGTLAAGGTVTVTASTNSGVTGLTAGSYSDTVTFTNSTNGTGNTTRGVSLTVTAASVAGPLTVTPAGGLTSSWTIGSTYTPVSQAYVLTNTGTASMAWTASKVASWVTLSSTGGTLAAGGTVTVTASTNSGVTGLTAGSYSDTVTFTNSTNGTGNTTRGVSLTVTAAVSLTSIAISGAASVNEGATSTYTATATWNDGTTMLVTPTWSVTSGPATISAQGS